MSKDSLVDGMQLDWGILKDFAGIFVSTLRTRMEYDQSTIKRLLKSIHVNQESGCWEWTGYVKANGYGTMWAMKKDRYVHRISYEYHVGNIPDGLEIDHLCRNRACCNPEHLEAVTSRMNVLRGNAPTAMNHRKQHCIRGHLFNEANTTWLHRGSSKYVHRQCRVCRRNSQRQYEKRKKVG